MAADKETRKLLAEVTAAKVARIFDLAFDETTRKREARIAASEIARVIDLAFEGNSDVIKEFAGMLTIRIAALMDGSTRPCCDSDEELASYMKEGAHLWDNRNADDEAEGTVQ